MSKTIGDKLGPAHRDVENGETYEEYKIRQKKEQQMLKNYLKGDRVWATAGKKTKAILLQKVADPADQMDIQTARAIMRAGQGTLVKSRDGVPRSRRRKVA